MLATRVAEMQISRQNTQPVYPVVEHGCTKARRNERGIKKNETVKTQSGSTSSVNNNDAEFNLSQPPSEIGLAILSVAGAMLRSRA